MTRSHDTWIPVYGTDVSVPDQTETGITDVNSGATGPSTEGTNYNTW